MLKKYTRILSVISASATFLTGCGSSTNSDNSTPPSSANIVAGTFGGIVYANNTVLPGNGGIAPSYRGISIPDLAFNPNGQLLIAADDAVMTPGVNNWAYVNESSFDSYNVQAMLQSHNSLYISVDYDTNKYSVVYESVNGSWVPTNNGAHIITNSSMQFLAMDNLNNNLYFASESSIYLSSNSTWNLVNNQNLPEASVIYGMVAFNNKLYLATNAASNIGSIYTTNNGTWESVNGNTPDNSSIYALINDKTGALFAGTSSGKVYKMVNDLWLQEPVFTESHAITGLYVDSQNNLYIGDSFGYLFQFANNQIESLCNKTAVPDMAGISSITGNNSGLIVVGTKNGNTYQIIQNSWQPVVTGAVSNGKIITTYVNPIDNNIYVSGTPSQFGNNGDLYVYTWTGNNWITVNNEALPESGLLTRTILADSKNNLYVATFAQINGSLSSGSVFESVNGHWIQVNNSALPIASAISSMQINPLDDNIYIGATVISAVAGIVFESVAGQWVPVNQSTNPAIGYCQNRPGNLCPLGPISINKQGNLFAANGGFFGMQITEESWGVYESREGAWALVNNQNIPDTRPIIAMVATESNLYASTLNSDGAGSVYESANGTWILVNGVESLPDNSGAISIQIDNNNNLFVSTITGNIYESYMGSWKKINNYHQPVLSFGFRQ